MIPLGGTSGFLCIQVEAFDCICKQAQFLHMIWVPAQWRVERWETALTYHVLELPAEAHW